MKKILGVIEEYQDVIKVVVAIVGLVSLMLSLQNISEEANKKERIIDMWEEQLPEGHWRKKELYEEILVLGQRLEGIALTTYDYTAVTIGQTNDIGPAIEKAMEEKKNTWKRKYVLKYKDTGKKVKTIKLKQGESVDLEFYYGDVLKEFDLTEKERNEKLNFLVLSCVEETDIATVYDGTVTAHKKGKTTLYLYCDGEIWEYNIKVK